jgi:hypothetical protein
MLQDVARSAAQKEFSESGVAIKAHYEHVVMSHLCVLNEAVSNRQVAFDRHFYLSVNTVPLKQSGDVGTRLIASILVRAIFSQRDQPHVSRLLQKG